MAAVLVRLVSYRDVRGLRSGAVVDDGGTDRLIDLGSEPLIDILVSAARTDVARATIAAADVTALPAVSEVRLEPPVRPRSLLCLGYNYRGHVPDGADPTADDPASPDVFVKTANTIGGPADPVVIPDVADDVDYEGEVAVVIGRRTKNVSQDDALDSVAGYTILNDVSDRSWQRRQSQWALGKCFDGFAPIGPWIVTPDEAGDPQDMLVEVIRDGAVTVSQSTATTIFSVAYVVSYLSTVMTLEPGDIVSTGTPQKLPAAQDAHRPLRPGDAVTVRIERLGELTTTFIGGPA